LGVAIEKGNNRRGGQGGRWCVGKFKTKLVSTILPRKPLRGIKELEVSRGWARVL